MFTGIIEGLGSLLSREPLDGGVRLAFSHPRWTDGLEKGASIAVDGCCLTVVAGDRESFSVEATRETLARTRFAGLRKGQLVNLERPLRVGDRLGGHWVQGHVDALLPVVALAGTGETRYLEVALVPEARAWVLPQGSVALNGVSLTVLDVTDGALRVALIPHTWETTNLSQLQAGSHLHVEYDILAKYITAAIRLHSASMRRSQAQAR